MFAPEWMSCAIFLVLALAGFVPDAEAQPPAASAQSEYFEIRRFDIVGSRVLSQAELDVLVAPFTGPDRQYQDIQKALEAIELAYRRQGYAAVQVKAPEQELTSGIVRLQVIETIISRVTVANPTKWFDEANLRSALPGLKEGATPNTRNISSQLALANENPARHIEISLGIGAEEGRAEARIKSDEDNPLRFTLALDNTGTAQTGRSRAGLSIQHANLFDRDHVVSAAWQTSPEKSDKVNIYSLSYRIPVYSWSGAFDLIAAKSNVNAGITPTTAGDLAFSGSGTVLGLRYSQALPRQGDANHKAYLGWSVKAYDNTCTLGSFGAAGCGASAVDVTLRPLTLGYQRSLASPGRSTDLNAEFIANLPGGSHGQDSDVQAARPSPTGGAGARARFHYLRGSLNHLHALEGDWQLRLTANAQYAGRALLNQEQLGLAGSSAVRGFLEREVARDEGVLGSLEGYTPSFAGSLRLTGSLRALAFLDAGSGRNHLLAGETQPKSSLASWGLGLRYGSGKEVSAKLDAARVLAANGNQSRGDWRGHFSLMVSF